MIRVVKPAAPPILLSRGAAAAQAHRDAYDAAPGDYRRGQRAFRSGDFDRTIYAAEEVKRALFLAQHKKCAFCESFVAHISHGHVEHFRPKSGYRQRKGGVLHRPGYYWLAYDWDNLFFSCELCNQQFKENLFPLRDRRTRARCHHDPIDREEPLIVDPGRLGPEAFITFRRQRAFPVRGSREGKATIRALGLNRPALVEARGRRLQTIRDLSLTRDLLVERMKANLKPVMKARLAQVNKALAESQSETSEYSVMIRAFFKK